MTHLSRERVQAVSCAVIALCLLVIVTMQYIVPFVATRYYAGEFRRLTAECDHAMHEEAALREGTAGAAKDAALTISANVALAICHDYDKLRKRMLILGVTEHRLSLFGLEALEVEQIKVERMVQPHRLERF